jgi:hypothetical protein
MNRQKGLGLSFKLGIVLTLGLAAGLLAISQASAQGATVSLGRPTINVGATTKLNLKAEDVGGLGLAAWIVDVSYDSSVVEAVTCSAHAGGFCNPAYASNTVRTNGATVNGLMGDITLASLTFRCTHAGTSVLALYVKEFADATTGHPNPITTKVVHGAIGCVAAGPPPNNNLGDVNCDGRVNSVDAALVLQYTARLIHSLPCPQNADMNDDGHITAVDAAIILQMEAGLI